MQKSNQKKGPKALSPAKRTSAPVAVATTRYNQLPNINGQAGQTIVIKRRELVGTVTNGSSTTFIVTDISQRVPGYDISPTNALVFPWASGVANAFEKFRFSKLNFELISSQPSTSAGRVYMAVDPDWDDPVPSSKSLLAGLACSVSSGVWEDVRLDVPCAVFNRGMEWRYCNVQNRENPEPRTSYMGFLAIGVDAPAPCTWDLWVDYELHLSVPTAEPATAASLTGTIQYPTAGTICGVKFSNPGGNVGVRDMASVLGHYFVPGNPCDLIEIPPSKKGLMACNMVLSQSSKSPSTALFTDALHTVLNCLDKDGNLLQAVDGEGDSASIVDKAVGVYNSASSIGTAGVDARQLFNVRIEDILSRWPATRYIVPYITTASLALFGSNKLFNVKFEL